MYFHVSFSASGGDGESSKLLRGNERVPLSILLVSCFSLHQTGFWYPMGFGGTFTAAPNTVFEVSCGDPEITKKISLRPQVDVVFDSKANQLVFAFDLPGFDKKDVSVEVDNRCIAISGEWKGPRNTEIHGNPKY